MRIIRYLDSAGQLRYGIERLDGPPIEAEGDPFANVFGASSRPADVRKLLAPIAPVNILAVGLNYRQHAEESKLKVPEFPVLFMKATNSVCARMATPIELPRALQTSEVDYECELAVVIGKGGKNIARKNALKHVLGYMCANDVSARDWQLRRGGTQWCRGKTFDTFCPLGPALVTSDEIPNPNSLSISTILNGETVQDWDTGDMIFDVPALIEFLSASTTLLPGTLILTGTPQGVGAARKPPLWLKPGDSVTVEIENVGKLTNPVVEEQLSV